MLSKREFVAGAAATASTVAICQGRAVAEPFLPKTEDVEQHVPWRGSWAETPVEDRLHARLRDGRLIEYSELRKGDEFQAIKPDGLATDPFQHEIERDDIWCRCTDDPIHSPFNRGWAVQTERIDGPL